MLDSLLRRSEVVDRFESLIWTERYSEIGDFEVVIASDRQSRSQFRTGTKLAMNESVRVMIVETIEDAISEDGKPVLKVSGRSLEAILEDRAAKNNMSDLTVSPEWSLNGTPGDICRQIFRQICIQGVLSVQDIIPFITEGNFFPADTIPEPGTPIIVKLGLETVYSAIKNLCDIYDLGFRLVRNTNTSQLYFNIYSGNDRTTRQKILPAVVFSNEMDNLQNTTELTSTSGHKNVAYVFSEFGTMVVYPEGVDPDLDGFDRRVLLVDASDITEETPDVQAALHKKGVEELAKSRAFAGFDGELNEYSSYKYGVDYLLGDLVETRDVDGNISYKRATEQIMVSDTEGERSYPTLSTNHFISSNTWLSQPPGKVWADYTDEVWSGM